MFSASSVAATCKRVSSNAVLCVHKLWGAVYFSHFAFWCAFAIFLWHLGVMEAVPGGGEVVDHVMAEGEGDGAEIFFKGSISEAIVRAQAKDLVLIVFVAGRVWGVLALRSLNSGVWMLIGSLLMWRGLGFRRRE